MNRSFKTVLKRIGAIVLSACIFIVAGSVDGRVLDSFTAKATEGIIASGTWFNYDGVEMSWSISASGVITISGNGAMDIPEKKGAMKVSIEATDSQPWYKYKDSIREVVISNGVTVIGDRAFEGKANTNHADYAEFDAFMGITKVSCAGNTSLTRIGAAAFQNCQNLVELDLSGCSNLEIIAGNDSPTWGGNNYGNIGIQGYMEEGAFSDCINLVSVNLAGCSKIKEIGPGAFHNGKTANTFLTSFDYSALTALETIGTAAFKDNASKITIDFSVFTNLKTIGKMAFRSNSGVTSVNLSGNTNLQLIDAQAFYQENPVNSINSVDLSGCTSLKEIGKEAFCHKNSGKIQTVNLSGCTALKTIGENAFKNQPFTSIVIPNAVTSIHDKAFASCNSLTSVIWEAENYSSEGNSFSLKTVFPKVTEVHIGAGVTELPTDFFNNINSNAITASFAPRSSATTIRMRFPYGTNTDTNKNVLDYTVDENGNVYYGETLVFPAEEVCLHPRILSAPTAMTYLYTGTEYPLVSAGVASSGAKMMYSLNGTDYSEEIPKETDAGNYKIYYRAVNKSDATDYTDGTLPVSSSIARVKNPAIVDTSVCSVDGKNASVDFSEKLSGLPDETDQSKITYSISNKAGGSINKSTGIYNSGNNPTPGEYFISVVLPESKNYNAATYRIPISVNSSSVNVTFNANGGNNGKTITLKVGEKIPEASIPTTTRKGYTFKYWYLAIQNNVNVEKSNINIQFDFENTNIVSSVTLKAYWNPVHFYAQFDSNGATGNPMPNQEFVYGVSQELSSNSYSKEGYLFNEWTREQDGSGSIHWINGQSVSNFLAEQDAILTLYAQWKPISYTVKFHANGGSGSMDDQNATYDSPFTLSNNLFQNEGNLFLGWAESENGDVKYANTQEVKNLSSTDGGTVDLYAVWGTLSVSGYNGTYDGKAHSVAVSCSSTDAVIEYSVNGGTDWTGVAPSVTDVSDGELSVLVRATVGNNTFTTEQPVILKVTPKPVTISARDASKEYDGSALTQSEFSVNGLDSGDTHTFLVEMTSDSIRTAVGTTPNVIAEIDGVSITTGSEKEIGNYLVTTQNGSLTVSENSKTIVISSESKTWKYDGELHKYEKYSVTYDGSDVPADSTGKIFTLPIGDTITITATAEGVKYYNESYDINNTFTYVLTNADSYSNVTASAGTLSISKCPITIKAVNITKAYDNNAATDPILRATIKGVPGNGVAPVYSLSRAAGQDANDYAISVTAEAALNPNYDVTVELGVFSISKCPVTIKAEDITKVYDNDATTDPKLTATVTGVPENGVVPVYTLSRAQGQSVGEYAISVTLGDNSNYDVTVEAGMFSISKCPVTIKADNKTKVYDNDAATDPELTATVTGVVSGDTINYTLSRAEGQNVGEYAITVTSGNNPNYDVTVEAGTFSITAKEAALTWSDTEFPYDGKSHLPSATVSNLVDGDTCEVTVEGTKTEIGDDYTANATALSNPNYKLPADATTTFKIIGCTITFVDEDGTELQSGIVEYGTKPSYTGKTPVKAATAQYSYEFLNWSPTITEVTGDKTYTATYKPILNAYTVTWKDEDGTVLETDKDVPYGTVPTYDGKEPTKAPTAEYSFMFDGWSIKVSEVTGDITYTATYAKSAIEYTVEAENLPEGTQLSFSGKETVEAGKVLTFKVLLADGYEASDDLVVTVNGTKIAPNADGSYTIPSVMTNSVISVTGVVKVDYNLTEGENAEYKQGVSKNARFVFKRTVNDKVTFGRFTYAELDGKLLDPNNYTKVSGSLILELKKEFLDTLPAGEHLLKVYFSDDKEGVIAHFLISAGITPTVTVTVTPAPDSNPTTGDTSNPIPWIILIGAAVLGLIGMVYSRSRMER